MHHVAKMQNQLVEQQHACASAAVDFASPVCDLMPLAVRCISCAYETKINPENSHYVSKLEHALSSWLTGITSIPMHNTARLALQRSMSCWLFLTLNHKSKTVLKQLPSCTVSDYVKNVDVFSKLLPNLGDSKDVLRCLYLLLQQPIAHVSHNDARKLAQVKHRVFKLCQSQRCHTRYHDITDHLFYQPAKNSLFNFSKKFVSFLCFVSGFLTCMLVFTSIRLLTGTCIF